jgi:predicted TIM-barrel fold metal-dependent hydrolase
LPRSSSPTPCHPFFPTGQVIAPAPSADDFELRLAGLRAHNRWLSDFCSEHPERRAGLAQVFLNDVDEAVRDVRWAKDHGLAGILLPGVSPDTPWIDPLFTKTYDPLWAVCQELEMPVTHHSGGSGIPDYPKTPVTTLMFIMESGFFANRALWHLIMSGVFERFPGLVFAMTEQGSAWIPEVLDRMEGYTHRWSAGASVSSASRGGGARPQAQRLLPPQLLRRRQLPQPERCRGLRKDRSRSDHVGQ